MNVWNVISMLWFSVVSEFLLVQHPRNWQNLCSFPDAWNVSITYIHWIDFVCLVGIHRPVQVWIMSVTVSEHSWIPANVFDRVPVWTGNATLQCLNLTGSESGVFGFQLGTIHMCSPLDFIERWKTTQATRFNDQTSSWQCLSSSFEDFYECVVLDMP